MANWPTNPDWIDPATINAGKEYEPADGITSADFNKIINNMLYLKEHGIMPAGAFHITSNSTYDISKYKYVEVNVPQAADRPQLYAPTISLSGDIITITNPAANGSFVTQYNVYIQDTYLGSTTAKTFDLSTYDLPAGTYSIRVKCLGTNFNDSEYSNTVEYKVITEYAITTSLTHVTAVATNPTFVPVNGSVTLKFTTEEGYDFPSTVTVTNCTQVWNKDTGTLILSNATGPVNVTVVATAHVYSIAVTLENCTADSSNPSTISREGTASLIFTANEGYELPESVSVNGATYTWEKSTGILALSNPTSNVSINVVATKLPFKAIVNYEVLPASTTTLNSITPTSLVYNSKTETHSFTIKVAENVSVSFNTGEYLDIDPASITSETSGGIKTLTVPISLNENNIGSLTSLTTSLGLLLNLPQLSSPANLTADGTTVSWDAVENAESYDVYADDTVLLGNTTGGAATDELAGTWVFNDRLFSGNLELLDIEFIFNFDSSGSHFIGAGISLSTRPDSEIGFMNFNENENSALKVYDSEPFDEGDTTTDRWLRESFKTITITSKLSEVTNGGVLLTWLQANGTKQ